MASKDFKNSYEQRRWESALKLHRFYTEAIAKASNYMPSNVLTRWKAEKERLETEYPSLLKN